MTKERRMTYYGEYGIPRFKKIPQENKKRNYKNEIKAEKRENVLDSWFSKYIRLRDCPDDSMGFCRCITCGNVYNWKEITNGHYIRRDKKHTRWHENNCHAQCVSCNSYHNGEEVRHREAMVKMYGDEFVCELEEYSMTPYKKMLHEDVEALIAKYKTKSKEEAERVGVIL
jgi:hypothetical protein